MLFILFIQLLHIFSLLLYHLIWELNIETRVRNNCTKKCKKIKLSHAVDNNNVYNDGTSDTKSHFFCLYLSRFYKCRETSRILNWCADISLYMENIIAVVAMYQFNELVFATKNEKNDSYIFHPSCNLQCHILSIYR